MALAHDQAVATMTGTVATDPRAVQSTAGTTPTARPPLVVLRVQVHEVTARGEVATVASPILVFADPGWLDLPWHTTIRFTGRLRSAEPGQDVIATASARGPPHVLTPAGPIERAAGGVRIALRRATGNLPPDPRGLVPALVLGDTAATPAELTQAMRATGLTHLSAVSGSNVSFVLAFAMLCCRAAGLPRRLRPVVAGLVLAGFVILARPEPSVLRAAAMGAIGLLGLSASRRSSGPPALAAAILVLLFFDPWLSRSYGFVLSTLATLGLLVFAHEWGTRIGAHLPRRLSALGMALAIPVAAQLMCAPVIVLLQGSVSVVAIPANLLAAPFVAPATILGVGTAVVAVIWPSLAAVLAWCAALPAMAIALVARVGSGFPGAQLPWPDGAPGAIGLAVLSLLALLVGPWLMASVRAHRSVAAALGVVALASTWPLPFSSWPPTGWLLVMCDVGQGDGMALSSGHGHAVVVDTGPDPRAIDKCLTALHVSIVDAIVLTHFHADHVGGLAGVLRGRHVGAVYVTPLADPAPMAAAVRTQTAAAGVPEHQLVAGDRPTWGTVHAQVLWPAWIIHAGSMPNNASIAMLVQDDGLRLLMLGDVEHEAAAQVRRALQQDRSFRGVDVLKVAHHGSANQDPALIALSRARVALISVGRGNDYGMPNPKLLGMLAANRMRVYRTDVDGTISIAGLSTSGPMVRTTGG